MNLRELEYLVALAEHRNFHRAAEACHVSQPTLSAQIRKLEKELGVVLFERAPRNLIVTAAGEAAIRRARNILHEVAHLKEEAAQHVAARTRRLRFGVFPTLGPYLLPHLVPRFIRHFPRTELLLTEEKSAVLLRSLLDGQIDAALLALPVDDPHLAGEVVFSEPFRLAVPAGHALAGSPEVTMEALASQRVMLLEEGHCLRSQALDLCRYAGAREYDDFRGTSLETLRQMVIAGMGVTLLPMLACIGSNVRRDMALLPFAGSRFQRQIGLFWRKSSAQGDVMAELGSLIRATAQALMAPDRSEDGRSD